MSDYNNQQQQRPKTILNHRALTMYAPNGEGKFANMSFDIRRNDVNIMVRSNIPADANNDYGRLQAPVPFDMFYVFLEMIKEAATANEPFRWAYEHRDRKFIGPGKMTDEPVLIYRLVVGREENGVVYISVVLDKRPNIKFSFLNNAKTTFKDSDGNEMPKNLESKFLALGKIKALSACIEMVAKDLYKHPEPKQQNSNGWGNRGNNNGSNFGNNSGGSGNNNTMESQDIPW